MFLTLVLLVLKIVPEVGTILLVNIAVPVSVKILIEIRELIEILIIIIELIAILIAILELILVLNTMFYLNILQLQYIASYLF